MWVVAHNLALTLLLAVPMEPSLSPLCRAAYSGDKPAVEAALAADVPVDSKAERDWTALHCAAIGGQAEVAELLLKHGANPDARGQFDMTPLHWATLRGHDQVISVLASRGAKLEARDIYGRTPLHLSGTEAVVSALATAGAKLDQRDLRGFPPLFTARTKEAGQALLARGANLNVRADDGRSLFDMLVVNTMEPQGLILFGRRSAGRLRGEKAELEIQIGSVFPVELEQLSLRVETEAASSVDPPVLPRLRPGELTAVRFALERRPGFAEGVFPMAAQVTMRGTPVGVFAMELDTSRNETPGDRGMARLGGAQLRSTPSRHYQLLLLAVPVVILAGWWFVRRKDSVRSKSGPAKR